MGRKMLFIGAFLLILSGLLVATPMVASAASADECKAKCAGSDGVVQGDQETKCVEDCLKGAAAQSAPAPAKPEQKDDEEEEGPGGLKAY